MIIESSKFLDKIIKKYSYTSREIDIYRKEIAPEAQEHTEATNRSLILLRRRNLTVIQTNERLRRSVEHFNRVVKSKKIDEIVRLFRYLIRQ